MNRYRDVRVRRPPGGTHGRCRKHGRYRTKENPPSLGGTAGQSALPHQSERHRSYLVCFLIRDERSRPSHATCSRQRDQYRLDNHDLSTNWRAVIIPRFPLLSPAFGEGCPIDWIISNGTVGCYFKAVLFLPEPGTQSGGFQKMCGPISSTRFSPSCAMMRSTSVWKISSAR